MPRAPRRLDALARLRAAVSILGAAALAPSVAAAQTTATSVTVDVGAAVLGQAAVPRVLAPTLGAEWRRDAVRSTLRASAGATVGDANRWAVQGVGAGSWFLGSARAPRELGAVGSAVRMLGVPAASSLSILARQHLSTGDYGAWVGGMAGVTARGAHSGRGGAHAAPIGSLDGAVWRQSGTWRFTLGLSALATRVDTARHDYDGLLVRRRYSAVDAVGGVTWQRPRLELAADVGVRRSALGGDAGARYGAFALASAVLPLHPSVALVATAGNQFADPVRGTPAVRHVSLALRLRPATWRAATALHPRPLAMVADDGDSTTIETGARRLAPAATLVVEGDGGDRVVRVSAPADARRVELRADATGWRSVVLAPRGGRWEAALRLAPGTHRVMVRIDEGAWTPPSNLPSVDDEFGSRVGLLVVP